MALTDSSRAALRSSLEQRTQLLAKVPLFSAFSAEELAALAPRFSEQDHAKGVVLFEEGDAGGDFFVVAHGELEVLGGETRRVINRLGPGDHLGEIAILLGGRRTATVRVSRAARLLTMGGSEFSALMASEPRALMVIARDLSRELDARTRGVIPKRETLTVGVTGASGLEGRTLISGCLAELLARHTGARVRTLERPDRTDGCAEAIERAQAEFPIVVLDLGSHEHVDPASFGRTCDVVVELIGDPGRAAQVDYGPAVRVLRVVNLHNRASRGFALNRCEPFLVRDDPELARLSPRERVLRICDDPRSPAAPALHRLARKVCGATVGVALAGGAAFGLAHVGVLQVLEEAGIPIDMLTGTSMGSIVGALYATGLSGRELGEVVRQKSTVATALSAVDPALARPGLLAGRRLTAILRDLGLTGTFEDLALPYQAMATDIESGERVPIGTGELAAACRASASLPAIFAPPRRDGRILVDGGVVDQVPAALVREMGADVCIAVTVIPTLRKGVRTVFTRVSDTANALNPLSHLAGARGMPTLIDLVMNALQMLQYQLGSYEALAADAQLEVDTSDFTWVDFHRAPELIDRGARAAEAALPRIQRMLAERPVLAG